MRTATTALAVTIVAACGFSHARKQSMEANNEGVAAFRRKLYPQAVTAFERALALDPDNVEAYHNLALVHMEKEEWSAAALRLAKTVLLQPDDALAHYQLGTVYEKLERFEQARQEFERAVQIDETIFKAYFELGAVCEALDDPQCALQRYTDGIRKNPRFLAAYGRLGALYADLGYLAQAEQVLRAGIDAAADASEERADLHHRLGTVMQETAVRANDAAKMRLAVREFERALEIVPAMGDALFSLGWTYAHPLLANREEARVYLQRFIDVAGARARPDYVRAARDRLNEMSEQALH